LWQSVNKKLAAQPMSAFYHAANAEGLGFVLVCGSNAAPIVCDNQADAMPVQRKLDLHCAGVRMFADIG
jgi:hypothetical protein